MSTRGSSTSAAPATGPSPVTMLTTPGGSSSASKICASTSADSGVCSAGLSTAVQPAASAGRQLPGGHQQRVVPGDDLPDDADRLAHHHRQRVVGHRQRLAVDLGGQAAVVLEAVRGVGDVELRLDDRLAHVAGLELGQLGGARADRLGDLEEQRAALAPGPARERPVVEGGARVRHRVARRLLSPPRARWPGSIDRSGSPPGASCRCARRPTCPPSTSSALGSSPECYRIARAGPTLRAGPAARCACVDGVYGIRFRLHWNCG